MSANAGTDWMKGGNIEWHGSLEEARRQAASNSKLVLIDLFNPG
jgi:hypothetical protein